LQAPSSLRMQFYYFKYSHQNFIKTVTDQTTLKFKLHLRRGHRGHDHMVVRFKITCAISAYHHLSCEFEPHSWRGVLNTTSCDKICQLLATGQWCTTVSSTNKTNRHNITEILLKVTLNTINQTKPNHLKNCWT